jgi:hypothetical protein
LWRLAGWQGAAMLRRDWGSNCKLLAIVGRVHVYFMAELVQTYANVGAVRPNQVGVVGLTSSIPALLEAQASLVTYQQNL